MRRRFDKIRREKKEERKLLADEKEYDEEDDVFEEGEGLQVWFDRNLYYKGTLNDTQKIDVFLKFF